MTRALGASVMPLENRRDTIVHLATEAERQGYDACILTETWAHDTTVLLGEIAARTGRIALGTGVLGVWGRSAATVAMAAATLHDISGGRFTLGLGASTAQLAEGLHDVPFGAPARKMRQVITQVRALLAGERIPLHSANGARPLRLNLPPTPGVPIHVGGLSPETIRLTGELADGWLPFLYPRSRLGHAVSLLEEGAARTTTPRELPRICPILPTVVAEDPAEARRGAAWFIAFYLTSMGPFYPQTISRQGFDEEVRAVIAANSVRGSAIVPPEAERLLDELTVHGTPAEARARLDRWREAGADLPIVFLPPNLDRAQIDFTLRALR